MENDIFNKFNEIERKHQRLKKSFIVAILTIMVGNVILYFKPLDKFDIITAKGIVITDAMERDRILIGSPIPYSKNRVRTDTTLVRQYWASKFHNPNQYMEWYANYKNSAEGIVFMNEKGFDVVQVGDNLSDANAGKRLFRSTGILFNTQDGWERGGAGVNTTKDGKSRPTIGLDDESGEALHLICLEDGSKGIIIGGENGSLRIGMAKEQGELFQNNDAFTGIKFFDNNGELIWEQKMNKK